MGIGRAEADIAQHVRIQPRKADACAVSPLPGHHRANGSRKKPGPGRIVPDGCDGLGHVSTFCIDTIEHFS